MRVGILGAGNISDTHARAAVSIPGVEIAAVYGANSEKAIRLARQYGGAIYDNLAGFLHHRPMDIVAIGSPSGLHAEQSLAAIGCGLHVLIEKPVDITTKRVDSVIAAADAAGVKVGVFFQDRLKPDVVELKRLVGDGCLGTPILVSGHVRWYRPPKYYGASRWRGTFALDGGGALMNQGIHTVDLLVWLFGTVARVRGSVATRLHSIEAEDTAAGILEFTSGALGVIEATTAAFPGYARRVEITGSEGTAILDDDQLVAVDVQAKQGHRDNVVTAPASASSPVVADASAHRRVFEDFIRAIQTNGAPACDAREGRRSVAVVEAIYRSAREGGVVGLS